MKEPRPTLSVLELTSDMRACGVKTSMPKVKAMIEQGKYAEFAVSCKMKNTEYEIYRKPYEKWKKRNILPDD